MKDEVDEGPEIDTLDSDEIEDVENIIFLVAAEEVEDTLQQWDAQADGHEVPGLDVQTEQAP